MKSSGTSIFISHSGKDVEIIRQFCDKLLRLSLNLSREAIFCTSIEAYPINAGKNFHQAIKDALINASHTIQIITQNYKESEVCLNEMGASWVLTGRVIPFILHHITYENVGFIPGATQLLRLNEKKDILKFLDEMIIGNQRITFTGISRHVDDFIAFMDQEKEITAKEKSRNLEIEADFDGDWLKYLEANLNSHVPVDNKAPAGKYTTRVRFIIDKEGYVRDALAITDHGYGMEEEALRVIRNSPLWRPPFQKDRNVHAYRTQPVTFLINEE